MKNSIKFFPVFLLLAIATSCTKEGIESTDSNTIAHSRTNEEMSLHIITSGDEEVFTTGEKVSVSNANGSTFVVTINPNTFGQVTYTAVSIEASQSDNGLHIVKNPGMNQTSYFDKGLIEVTAYGSSALQLSINPGSIVTTGSSIIIDEMSGL